MSDQNKPIAPILKTTDLKEENLKANPALDAASITEAIGVENEVYYLEYLREEILSLFDIVSPHIKYGAVASSELFNEENSPVPRKDLKVLVQAKKNYEEMFRIALEDLATIGRDKPEAVEKRISFLAGQGFDEATVRAFLTDEKTLDIAARGFTVSAPKSGDTFKVSPLTPEIREAINRKIQGDLKANLSAQDVEEEDLRKYLDRFEIFSHSTDNESKILFADFIKLIEESDQESIRDILTDLIYQDLREEQKRLYTEKSTDKKSRAEAMEAAELNAETKLEYIDLLLEKIIELNAQRKTLLDENEGDAKLDIYRQAFSQDITRAITQLGGMSRAVKGTKSVKSPTRMQPTAEMDDRLGLSGGKTLSARKRIDRIIKKQRGQNYTHAEDPRAVYDELGNLVNKDFLTAYANYSREMRNLYRLLNQGKVVETKYVKAIIEEAMSALTKNPPGVVYLHGDTGTGKTAIAVHISRTRFKKEPIIVSGSKFLEPDRFTEEFKIEKRDTTHFFNEMLQAFGITERLKDDQDQMDIISLVVGKKQEIMDTVKQNRIKESGELTSAEEAEIKKMVDDSFTNSVQGRYVLGAMYRAMKEGKPLIIDEANAITPEVLIAFNDLMTKKIGAKVQTRTDEKDFEIQPGYCVIWTGNTGGRYRQARYNELDPASFSRIHPIKVQYLPQSKEGTQSSFQVLAERLNMQSLGDTFVDESGNMEGKQLNFDDTKARASKDQIFQVLLLKVLNQRMGTFLLVKKDNPNSFFEDLYRLSGTARVIMDIFEGNADQVPANMALKNLIGSSDVETLKEKLQTANLSMRGLMDKILGFYQDEGNALDLEFYAFKYVKELAQFPEEMAIIYAMFQNAGFFQPSEGWCDMSSAKDLSEFSASMSTFDPLDKVNKYQKVSINGDYASMLAPAENGEPSKYQMRYFSSLETLQMLFGYLPPRKVEDYQKIAQKNVEARQSQVDEQKIDDLIGRLEEVKVFDGTMILSLFKKQLLTPEMDQREQSETLLNKVIPMISEMNDRIRSFHLQDKEYLEEVGLEAAMELVERFCDYIIEEMKKAQMISEEQAAQVFAAQGEEKVDLAVALIRNASNK